MAAAPATGTQGANAALSLWADDEPASAGEQSEKRAETPADGPFSPTVNRLLQASFGTELQHLTASFGQNDANRSLGAIAHTVGNHISLGNGIQDSAGDPHSIEAIGHEVAHALGGGSEEQLVSRPEDPAEQDAHQAGRELRRFVEGGGRGPVPKLRPAAGGRAVIHRLDGGEHVPAVDNAALILQGRGRPHGEPLDPAVTQQMQERIQLPNGLRLSPGMFSALMGDFYGRYRNEGGKNKLDPKATMAQMMSPDNREEMEQLIGRISQETYTGQVTPNQEFEEKTEARQVARNPTDSYMDLAENYNETHYSGEDPHGENNMGAYAAFHQLALEEAAKGDKADQNMLRAYEAASMHYLVDKHCAGHGIDKLAIKKAWSANHPILDQVSHRIGTGAAVKIIHDLGNDGGPNQAGVDVHNRAGETWPEFGDASFGRPLNAESRRRTAESIYTSYDELEAVRTGKKTLEEVQRAGYGINETVPQFDPAFQQAMEEETKDIGVRRIVDTLGTKENFGLLGHGVSRWASRMPGKIRDVASEKAGQVWNGAVDLGSKAWNGAVDTADRASDAISDTAGNVWSGAKDLSGRVWDGAVDTADRALNATTDAAGRAWSGAKDLSGRAVDGAVTTAGDVWNGANNVVDKAQVKAQQLGDRTADATGKLWHAAGDVIVDGWHGAGTALDKTSDAADHLWTGAADTVSNGADTISKLAKKSWLGAQDLGHRAWDKASGAADKAWKWATFF